MKLLALIFLEHRIIFNLCICCHWTSLSNLEIPCKLGKKSGTAWHFNNELRAIWGSCYHAWEVFSIWKFTTGSKLSVWKWIRSYWFVKRLSWSVLKYSSVQGALWLVSMVTTQIWNICQWGCPSCIAERSREPTFIQESWLCKYIWDDDSANINL